MMMAFFREVFSVNCGVMEEDGEDRDKNEDDKRISGELEEKR